MSTVNRLLQGLVLSFLISLSCTCDTYCQKANLDFKVSEVQVENIILTVNGKPLSFKDQYFNNFNWVYVIIKTGCQACNENALTMLKKVCTVFPKESFLVICNFDSKIDFKVIESDLKQYQNISLFLYPYPFVYYSSLPMKSTILLSWQHTEEKIGSYFVIENGDDGSIIKYIEKTIHTRAHEEGPWPVI